MALSAAVASGLISAVQAWPGLFDLPDEGGRGAFPSTDADMSGFVLERATPESFAADVEAIVRASQQVALLEEPPPQLPQSDGALPHHEWS